MCVWERKGDENERKNGKLRRKAGRRGKRINEGRKEETMEDGWKEGKEEKKEGILETRVKQERKYSNPLSTTLPGQCVTVADAHTYCIL
jgi:hypothetical protein